MKVMFSVLTIFVSMNCFANGSISGTSGDSYNQALRLEKDFNFDNLSAKAAGQVYFMRKKQAEIEFATNKAGDDKVEIQSLRPEEISSPALIEGLKRSQQTKQWENIKLPSKLDMNRIIIDNKLGGMQIR